MFIAGYFMLLFDFTHDRATSEGNIWLPVQGNIRVELQFDKPLSEDITICCTSNMTSVSR